MYEKSSVGLSRPFFLKSESVFGVCLVHGKRNGNNMSMEVIPEKKKRKKKPIGSYLSKLFLKTLFKNNREHRFSVL